MSSNAEYDIRELADAQRQLAAIEHAPLADRKEAAADWLTALRQPGLVAERVGWLIDGNYGYGQMLMAKQILKSPRMNQVAALSQLVAACEWRCPGAMARAQWKKLASVEQKVLERDIKAVIKEADSE